MMSTLLQHCTRKRQQKRRSTMQAPRVSLRQELQVSMAKFTTQWEQMRWHNPIPIGIKQQPTLPCSESPRTGASHEQASNSSNIDAIYRPKCASSKPVARDRVSDLCPPSQLLTKMCLLHSNLTEFIRSCCAGSPEAGEQGTPHCWPHGPGKGPSPLKTSAGGPASLSIGTWVPTAGLQSADTALPLSLTNVWHIGPAAHKILTIARQ